jgi:hypothetical protein
LTEDEVVGSFADHSLGRLSYGTYKGGFGYGLYFTNNRLIGISLKSIVSYAYRPGYLLELIGFTIAGSLAAYFVLTRPQGETSRCCS